MSDVVERLALWQPHIVLRVWACDGADTLSRSRRQASPVPVCPVCKVLTTPPRQQRKWRNHMTRTKVRTAGCLKFPHRCWARISLLFTPPPPPYIRASLYLAHVTSHPTLMEGRLFFKGLAGSETSSIEKYYTGVMNLNKDMMKHSRLMETDCKLLHFIFIFTD